MTSSGDMDGGSLFSELKKLFGVDPAEPIKSAYNNLIDAETAVETALNAALAKNKEDEATFASLTATLTELKTATAAADELAASEATKLKSETIEELKSRSQTAATAATEDLDNIKKISELIKSGNTVEDVIKSIDVIVNDATAKLADITTANENLSNPDDSAVRVAAKSIFENAAEISKIRKDMAETIIEQITSASNAAKEGLEKTVGDITKVEECMNILGKKLTSEDSVNTDEFYKNVSTECHANINTMWKKYGENLNALNECSKTLDKLREVYGDDFEKLTKTNVFTQQTEALKAQQAAEFTKKLTDLQEAFNTKMEEIKTTSVNDANSDAEKIREYYDLTLKNIQNAYADAWKNLTENYIKEIMICNIEDDPVKIKECINGKLQDKSIQEYVKVTVQDDFISKLFAIKNGDITSNTIQELTDTINNNFNELNVTAANFDIQTVINTLFTDDKTVKILENIKNLKTIITEVVKDNGEVITLRTRIDALNGEIKKITDKIVENKTSSAIFVHVTSEESVQFAEKQFEALKTKSDELKTQLVQETATLKALLVGKIAVKVKEKEICERFESIALAWDKIKTFVENYDNLKIATTKTKASQISFNLNFDTTAPDAPCNTENGESSAKNVCILLNLDTTTTDKDNDTMTKYRSLLAITGKTEFNSRAIKQLIEDKNLKDNSSINKFTTNEFVKPFLTDFFTGLNVNEPEAVLKKFVVIAEDAEKLSAKTDALTKDTETRGDHTKKLLNDCANRLIGIVNSQNKFKQIAIAMVKNTQFKNNNGAAIKANVATLDTMKPESEFSKVSTTGNYFPNYHTLKPILEWIRDDKLNIESDAEISMGFAGLSIIIGSFINDNVIITDQKCDAGKCELCDKLVGLVRTRNLAIQSAVYDALGSIRVFIKIRRGNIGKGDGKDAITIGDGLGVTDCKKITIKADYTGPPAKKEDFCVDNLANVYYKYNDAGKEEYVTNAQVYDSSKLPDKSDDMSPDLKTLFSSFYNGSNITAFAYGGSGSGKTYTLIGASDGKSATFEEKDKGVVNLFCDDVIQEIVESMKPSGGKKFKSFSMSILELVPYDDGKPRMVQRFKYDDSADNRKVTGMEFVEVVDKELIKEKVGPCWKDLLAENKPKAYKFAYDERLRNGDGKFDLPIFTKLCLWRDEKENERTAVEVSHLLNYDYDLDLHLDKPTEFNNTKTADVSYDWVYKRDYTIPESQVARDTYVCLDKPADFSTKYSDESYKNKHFTVSTKTVPEKNTQEAIGEFKTDLQNNIRNILAYAFHDDNRQTGSTPFNAVSSRSHAFVEFYLEFADDKIPPAKAMIADLAGIERQLGNGLDIINYLNSVVVTAENVGTATEATITANLLAQSIYGSSSLGTPSLFGETYNSNDQPATGSWEYMNPTNKIKNFIKYRKYFIKSLLDYESKTSYKSKLQYASLHKYSDSIISFMDQIMTKYKILSYTDYKSFNQKNQTDGTNIISFWKEINDNKFTINPPDLIKFPEVSNFHKGIYDSRVAKLTLTGDKEAFKSKLFNYDNEKLFDGEVRSSRTFKEILDEEAHIYFTSFSIVWSLRYLINFVDLYNKNSLKFRFEHNTNFHYDYIEGTLINPVIKGITLRDGKVIGQTENLVAGMQADSTGTYRYKQLTVNDVDPSRLSQTVPTKVPEKINNIQTAINYIMTNTTRENAGTYTINDGTIDNTLTQLGIYNPAIKSLIEKTPKLGKELLDFYNRFNSAYDAGVELIGYLRSQFFYTGKKKGTPKIVMFCTISPLQTEGNYSNEIITIPTIKFAKEIAEIQVAEKLPSTQVGGGDNQSLTNLISKIATAGRASLTGGAKASLDLLDQVRGGSKSSSMTDVRIPGLGKISTHHKTSKRKPIESTDTHQKHSEKPKPQPKKKIVRRVKKHKKSPTENDTIDEEFNAIENSDDDSDEPQKPTPKKLKQTSNPADNDKESDEEKPDEESDDDSSSDAETSGGFRGGISYD